MGELSATTRRYVYSVLRIALERAKKSRSIRENVATLADPPAKSTTSVEPWSRDEAGRFLEAVEGDRLEALYNLAMLVGLRQSELLGLTWRDLDLEGRRIRVRHQLQRGTLELVDLKTDESRRDLDLPARVADLLVEHRQRQQVIRLDGLVFVSSTGGPIEHRNPAHAFDRRVAEAGVRRINFHALRHCAASYQLDQGATIDEVKMMLGHTQRSTTVELYSHLLDRGRRAVADRADAMFPRRTARG